MTLLTGSHEQPNEAHDCQRLVVDSAFGPLVGIFPITGVVAGDSPEAFDSARVVASIYNWGGGYATSWYAPLRIARGLSCLWLVRETQPSRWDAAIVPAPSEDGCPRSARDSLPDAEYLEIHRTTHPHPDSVPETGRWAWDDRQGGPAPPVLSNDGQHYIGMKCADGWCSIGANDFQPSRPSAHLPGWFDEQHLAMAGSDGRLVPGPWGRIAPFPNPRQWEIPDFVWSTGGGKRVGTVTLEGTTDQKDYYADKRKFEFDSGGKTDLWLFKMDTGSDDTGWKMLMIAHDPSMAPARPDTTKGTVVDISRIPDVLHASPGAVRWRWSDNDEGTWSACGKACCTPQT